MSEQEDVGVSWCGHAAQVERRVRALENDLYDLRKRFVASEYERKRDQLPGPRQAKAHWVGGKYPLGNCLGPGCHHCAEGRPISTWLEVEERLP